MATTAATTTTPPPATTTTTPTPPPPPATQPTASKIVLPPTGTARVKSVLSGDTAILLGAPKAPGLAPPEVVFTLEGINAPR